MIRKGSIIIEGEYAHSLGSRTYGRIKVVDGIIAKVGGVSESPDLVFDPEFTIFPGFMDIHVHAREFPFPAMKQGLHDLERIRRYKEQVAKETFESMCRAAVNGGVVAFADMPNNPEPPMDEDSYRSKVALADAECFIDHLHYALITEKSRPFFSDIPYKLYAHDFSETALRETLRRYAGHFVAVHCENKEILDACPDRPASAEIESIADCIDIAEDHDIDMHISHISTKEGIDMVLQARAAGFNITCETTPTYAYFLRKDLGLYAKSDLLTMKPPVRDKEHRFAVLSALRRGDIDYLATDHAPHTLEDKGKGAFGIPLEDHYTNFVGWLLQNGVDEGTICKICSENPGKFFSRFAGENFGKIEEGFVGSFTVVAQASSDRIDSSMVKTKCGWTPFEGAFLGDDYLLYAHETIVRGVPLKTGPHRAMIARRC